MRRKNVMYSDYFKYALNDILSLLVSSISYKKSLENFFVFEMFELKSSVAEGNTLPLKLTTDRNVCACQIQAAAELTMAADAAIVTLALSRSGAEDRHTQPTDRTNETDGKGQRINQIA